MNSQDIAITAKVESITPIMDNNKTTLYNLEILKSNGENWTKVISFEEIKKMRNYLIKFVPRVSNLPFPQKDWRSFLPFVGHKYDDHNWDVLLENKFILDEFFRSVCQDKELYKLSEFNAFFNQPRLTLSILNGNF